MGDTRAWQYALCVPTSKKSSRPFTQSPLRGRLPPFTDFSRTLPFTDRTVNPLSRLQCAASTAHRNTTAHNAQSHANRLSRCIRLHGMRGFGSFWNFATWENVVTGGKKPRITSHLVQPESKNASDCTKCAVCGKPSKQFHPATRLHESWRYAAFSYEVGARIRFNLTCDNDTHGK